MRPVDLLPGAAHAFFDGTFDQTTGAIMLKIEDYKEKVAKAAPNRNGYNEIYTYFRNNYLWGADRGPTLPPIPGALPAQSPPRVLLAAVAAPVRNLAGIRNRDNTADIALQAQIVGVQTPVEVRRVRVVLPVDEGSDLVSAWNDGNWNGAAPPAIPDDVKTKVWRLISSTGTVPNVPVPAGVAFYGYRGAIKDLQAALGAYCSYCETRRSGADTHDVEHRLAKASYHSDILLWSNYLLGCKMCNEYSKGERPGRQFGITNAITAFHTGANAPPNPIVYPVVGVPANYAVSPVIPPGPARIRYDEMRRASQLYQLWPSVDDRGTPNAPVGAIPTNFSLVTMKYHMFEYAVAGIPPQAALVGQIPDADAVNLQNGNAIDGPDNTVQADIWDGVQGQLRQMFVRVEAVPTSPGTGNANFNARKLQAAQNTSTMVRLNTPINAWGDRRIIERTYAWLRAVGTLQLLLVQLAVLQLPQNAWMQQLFPGPNPTADVWNRVADAAEQGYYSVWVNVFKRFGVANPGPGNNNLASDLVTLLNNRVAVNTPFRYRGTNLQNSVIAQLPNL